MLWSLESQAAKRRPVDRGQDAIVVVEGAAVYKFPNFDAPILEYFQNNKRVKISNKKYEGIGGLGSFYKIRIRKGLYGYITDIDVVIQPTSTSKRPAEKRPIEKEEAPADPWANAAEAGYDAPVGGEPMFYRRYVGLYGGMLNFSEKVVDRFETESVTVFGLKVTGPGALFDGPPIDFEVGVSPSAPSYYSKLTSSPVKGFFIAGHLALMLPAIEKPQWYGYYGLGVMYVYAKYTIPADSVSIDSQELRLGLSVLGGAVYQVTDRFFVRAGAKYYYEKAGYVGAELSIQTTY
ncbi:MAG: hypothetical protein H6626_06485 [Pseudobdellovibrionaceae bacterium]|nr:MAG: hypothetical protein H6626_06485 [Pseudobdellovibrionaceae bacterium]